MSSTDKPTETGDDVVLAEGDNLEERDEVIPDEVAPATNSDQESSESSDSEIEYPEESNEPNPDDDVQILRSPDKLKRTSDSISRGQAEPDPGAGPSTAKKAKNDEPSVTDPATQNDPDLDEGQTPPKNPDDVDPPSDSSPDVSSSPCTPPKSPQSPSSFVTSSPKPRSPLIESILAGKFPATLQRFPPSLGPSDGQDAGSGSLSSSPAVIQPPSSVPPPPIDAPTIKNLLAQPPILAIPSPQNPLAHSFPPGLLSIGRTPDAPLLRTLLSKPSPPVDNTINGTNPEYTASYPNVSTSKVGEFSNNTDSSDTISSEDPLSATPVSTPESVFEAEVLGDVVEANPSEMVSKQVNEPAGFPEQTDNLAMQSAESQQIEQPSLLSATTSESREARNVGDGERPVGRLSDASEQVDNTEKSLVDSPDIKNNTDDESASEQLDKSLVEKHAEAQDDSSNTGQHRTESEHVDSVPSNPPESNVEDNTSSNVEHVAEERLSLSLSKNTSEPADSLDEENAAESKTEQTAPPGNDPEPSAESSEAPLDDDAISKVAHQKLKKVSSVKVGDSSSTDSPSRKSKRLQNRAMSGDQPPSSSEDSAGASREDPKFKKPAGTPVKVPKLKKLDSLGDRSMPESPSRRSARLQKVAKDETKPSEQADHAAVKVKKSEPSKSTSRERKAGKVEKGESSSSQERPKKAKTKEGQPSQGSDSDRKVQSRSRGSKTSKGASASSNSEADKTDESGDENKARAKRTSRRGSSK